MGNEAISRIVAEIVTDSAVIAKLPNAGPHRLEFHGFIFRWFWQAVRRRDWWTVRHYLWVRRMRMANCETVSLGPVTWFRPMPWLYGSAKQLYPEAFE